MWETDLEGYRRMMDDFISIFRVKSVDFDLRATHPDISIQYLEYAMKFGLKFKKVQVSVDEDNFDDNRRVLCACTQASEVYVTSYEYPKSFKFEGFHESNDGYKFEIERSDGFKAYVTCSGLTFTIEDSEFKTIENSEF
ncbi:hypothetical protein CAEBREN_05125 [Caenorhabditis brenneri]|uniref:DUF38 domain-containing protein n=1 Tax=Caenorhabditis brenneri TaxID=135651 RepID=G0PD73_CAEBE|nr:hypothetical protein CAEBREN_05125 [Caenorhabditis brenneri]